MAAPLLRWNAGSAVSCITVSHDGTRIVSGQSNEHLYVWDVRTGVQLQGPLQGHTGRVQSASWSHDDTRIVSCSIDETIRTWDVCTGAPIGEPIMRHMYTVFSIGFSPDSTLIASGSRKNIIRIWDTRTGDPIGEPLIGHTGSVYSIAFSSDSAYIVSGSADKTIRVWDTPTGAPIGKPLEGHTSSVFSVVCSPNNTRIASGSLDNTIRIWDARTGDPIGKPLRGHTDSVYSVAFSSDSTYIVSGSADNTIWVWDTRTGAPICKPLRGHTDQVRSVAFSPDSTRIISGSWDRSICVWQAPQITPSFDMVTSKMSAQEMFDCLVGHGCANLTSSTKSNRGASAVVASGGFGDVRRMVMDDGTVVAIKTLRLHIILKDNDKAVKRAVREVYIWSKLHHVNLQELLGIVVYEGALGMVSPWREQGNLQQYIAAHPDVERHPLCVQLTSGVSYLHGIGMVHGDLKASNVLVSQDGTLKINDFDHAILSDSTLKFSATTRPGGGTLRWMAPELLEPEGEAGVDETHVDVTRNKQSDVYALGMTILEIITGTVPYSEYRTEMGIYRAIHGKQPPRRPAQLSDPEERAEMMWSLLLKCWDHDPVARPDAATILELLKFERPPANPWLPILEAVQIGADIPTMPPPTTSQLIKFFEWLFHA